MSANWEGSGVLGTDTKIVICAGVYNPSTDVPPYTAGADLVTFEVLEVTPPAAEGKSVDMTHMTSVDFKEKMPGKIIEWTECEINVAYRPEDLRSGSGNLKQVLDDATVRFVKITFPEECGADDEWIFPGWVSAFEPQAPLEDRMTATIRIQCAGPIDGFTMYEGS